jgi:uncharacterized protein
MSILPFLPNLSTVMPPLTGPTVDSLLLTGGPASLLAAITYAGACIGLHRYQRHLLFRPLPHIIRTPAEIGLPYEDIWIPVGHPSDTSGGQIHSWWLPNPSSQKVLLFCHGNYGNISFNLDRIQFYHQLGFSVLAFDYRGYGQSSGSKGNHTPCLEPTPTEKSTFTDVQAAWHYLVKQRQIDPKHITVMGHSMGGAIAIYLATQHPTMARLIISGSFTTMQDVIHSKKIYRLFPVEQLLTEPFDSLSRVGSLQVPVLYIHGEIDPDIPAEMSQRLYDASPAPKEIWFAPNADHNNVPTVGAQDYAAIVKAFCENTTPYVSTRPASTSQSPASPSAVVR